LIGKYEYAKRDFKKSLSLNKSNPRLYYDNGMIHAITINPYKSVYYYTKGFIKDENSIDALKDFFRLIF
jgi:hypothetical protein